MLIFGVIAGLLLLYGCGSSLAQIASYLKDIRSLLHEIQRETADFSHRLAVIEGAVEDGRQDIKNIASVAEEYDGAILATIRKAQMESELFQHL